jgi:hypothetical protein
MNLDSKENLTVLIHICRTLCPHIRQLESHIAVYSIIRKSE